MTRAATGDVVAVAPSSNVYTALAAVGTVVALIALVVMFVRAADMFPNGLLG